MPVGKTDGQPQPVKTPYSEKDLAHFKNLLEKKMKDVEEQLYTLKHPMESKVNINGTFETHKEAGDIADQVIPEQNPFFVRKKISQAEKYLKASKAALGRIEDGTFGICFYTGEVIPRERLELETHTRYKSPEIKALAEKQKNK